MSKLIYKSDKPYHENVNDMVVEGEIKKGRALPVGTMRNWGGRDFIKHPDGWVSMKTGKLTSGKNMQEVQNHPNAAQHKALAEKQSKGSTTSKESSRSASQEAYRATAGSTIPESDNSPARKEDEERDNELAAARKDAKRTEGLATAHGQMVSTMNEANGRVALAKKLKNKPMHKELKDLKDEASAVSFVKNKLDLRPNPDYRGESGVYFNQSGGSIEISVAVDRYRRHDHGGGSDGDGWLDSSEIRKDEARGEKEHGYKKKAVERKLKELGIKNAKVEFQLGEKGHLTLDIRIENPNSWISKLERLSPEELSQVTVTSESGKVYRGISKERHGFGWSVKDSDGTKRGLSWNHDYKLSV